MGAGIAQVAAQAGHAVIVYDSFEGALERGEGSLKKGASALLKRGKIDTSDAEALQARVIWTDDINALKSCGLIIEAIIENRDIKTDLFTRLETIVDETAILATNTSSLSVSSLAARLKRPQNFLGLHFFNPAPIMKLVEVIKGLHSDTKLVSACFKLMEDWGKQAVMAKDVPGFIVNRVARPFYGEGWKAYEEGVASAIAIDTIFKQLGGFRMGPLELGDLIGHDINSKAARSIYESYFGKTRFHPSVLQYQMSESGLLGRKSGQGVYDYRDGSETAQIEYQGKAQAANIVRGLQTDQFSDALQDRPIDTDLPPKFWMVDGVYVGFSFGPSANALSERWGKDVAVLDNPLDISSTDLLAYSATNDAADHAARALITAFGKAAIRIEDRPGAIVFRTMLQLVNAAADAVRDKVGAAQEVDKALRFGVNYPFGPMAWTQDFGIAHIVSALEHIAQETGELELYSPNHYLRGLA